MKRAGWCIVLLCLLSLPLFGQYSATVTQVASDVLNSTYAPPSHFDYNCVAKSCWQEIYGSITPPAFESIAATFQGNLQALDTSGNRWYWDGTKWIEVTTDPFKFSRHYLGNAYINAENASELAISTANVPYYYSQGVGNYVRLGTSVLCNSGAIDEDGNYYCLNAGNAYWWNGSSWTEIYSGGNATAIAASIDAVVIVKSAGVYAAEPAGGTTWTQLSVGITPSTSDSALGIAHDGSFSILDTSGQLHVSHDGGSTFSSVNMDGFTVTSTTNTGAGTTFIIASSTGVMHLNTIVNASQLNITGNCGSACGGGNPQVEFDMAAAAAVECPTGWTTNIASGEDPYCSLVSNANTVQNATPLSLFTTCDGFISTQGPAKCDPSSVYQISISVINLATGLAVFASTPQDCECYSEPAESNQKYFVSSNNWNSPPTNFGLLGFLGEYQWAGSSVEQWCTNSPLSPNLQPISPNVRILAHSRPPKPTKMKGRYVNGDVLIMVNPKNGNFILSLIGAIFSPNAATLSVWGAPKPGDLTKNYDWNNTDTQLRGPGGQPTLPCQGK